MKYLQIQIKDDGIIFKGWHNYPTRYNIEYLNDEQLQALIYRIEYDLFPFILGRHEGSKLRFRIVNLNKEERPNVAGRPMTTREPINERKTSDEPADHKKTMRTV